MPAVYADANVQGPMSCWVAQLLSHAKSQLRAGIARVKPRDSPAAWGTDNESKMRQPEDPFFKKFAAECSRVQIAVDVFSLW